MCYIILGKKISLNNTYLENIQNIKIMVYGLTLINRSASYENVRIKKS